MATRMQQRRGTATQWTTANPILGAGEIGFETDTGKFKIGDGTNTWTTLSYFLATDDLQGSLDEYVTLEMLGEPEGVATLDIDGKVPSSQLPDQLSFDAEVSSAISDHIAATDPHGDRAYTDQEIALAVLDMQSFTNNTIQSVVGSAPEALNTLQEISAVIGDSEDISGSIISTLSTKAPIDGPTFTGTVSLPETTNFDGDSITSILSGINSNIAIAKASGDDAMVAVNTLSTDMDASFEDVQSDISGLDSRLVAVEQDIDVAKNDVVTINANITTAQGQISTLFDDMSDVQAGIVTNTNDIGSINSTLTNISGSISNINGEIDTIEVSVADVESDLLAHSGATTNVHGIADTAQLATLTDVNNAIIAADGVTSTTLNDYALLDSPVFTGTPSAPTATAGDNSTKIATTAYVDSAVSALVESAPETLNTLNELAAALGDDPNFATTVAGQIAAKADASHTHPISDVTNLQNSLDAKADKTSQINVMSGSHTIVADDVNNIREMSGGGTLSIPSDTSFWPVGQRVEIVQTGSSQVTIAGESGVTVNGTPGLKLRAQWSGATIIKRAANTFVVLGDLAV